MHSGRCAGEDIDAGLWHTIFGFSERTFLRHGNGHYLNVEFLLRVSAALPGSVVVKVAERAGTPVAAAIFFAGGGWLYGRYWGSAVQEDSLHFEACYYQGIEHCIEHGLQYFDPGTQGEHKLARGFEPTRTTSAHWLEHAGFRNAVARYLERERAAVDDYIAAARQHLPFQRTTAAPVRRARLRPATLRSAMIPWLKPTDPPDAFPPVTSALTDPDGLLCVGGDLRPRTPAGGLSARHLSLVLARVNPSCGGRPIRAWCCSPTNSRLRGAWASRCATAGSALRSTRASTR